MNYFSIVHFSLTALIGISLMGTTNSATALAPDEIKTVKRSADNGKFGLSKFIAGATHPRIVMLSQNGLIKYKKPSIENTIRNVIDTAGIEAGIIAYWHLKENLSDIFDPKVSDLNNLGYHYLREGETDNAIAVLNANAEAYPDDYNVYHRLGEAYMISGDKDKAIANYRKSVELNPDNFGGVRMLKKLVA